MASEEILIRECKRFNKLAQREVYEKYAPLLRAACFRYVGNYAQVKDVMQEGFIKIFSKIRQYKGNGSFEGWMKRIMINTAITICKKNKAYAQAINIDDVQETKIESEENEEKDEQITASDLRNTSFNYDMASLANFDKKELLETLNSIPENFRVVFNLYCIEEYKHKEISDILGIDENTSRTRLLRARKLIQQKLYEKCLVKFNVE